MKKNILALLFIIIPFLGFAQQNNLLYLMEKNPQTNNINPSFFPDCKWYITLPSVTNMAFTSPFSVSDIFQNTPGGKVINNDYVLSNLRDNNTLNFNGSVDLFGFGVRASDWLFTFSTAIRYESNLIFKKDFFGLVLKGNAQFEGQTASLLEKNSLEGIVWGEAAVGVAHKINEKLAVGLKAKALMGGLHVNSENTYIDVMTGADGQNLGFKYNLDMVMSSPFSFDSTDLGSAEFSGVPTNFGFGFDLGATYKLTDKIEFTASLLDIGFINWNQNLKKIVSGKPNNEYVFTGLDPAELTSGSMDFGNLMDSIKNMIKDYKIVDGGEAATHALPFKYLLSGSYFILPSLKASLLYRGEVRNGHHYASGTLGLDYTVGNWLELIVANTVNNGDWFNPGAGASFTIGKTFQFYFLVNYISDFRVVNLQSTSFNFGWNLMFGKSGNNKDKLSKEAGINLDKMNS